MPLPIFNFSVDANNALRTNVYRTKSVQFGDGYKQLAPAGINNKLDTWNLTLPMLTDLEVALVEAFFDPLGQHGNFNWTPPRGVVGIYRLTEPIKYQANGLDRGQTRTTVTLSIEKVYIGVVVIIPPPPSLPVISIAADGVNGWIINRSGSTLTTINVNYQLTVTPVSGPIVTNNLVIAIPSGAIGAFVSITGSGLRTENLMINSGSNYTVGSPSNIDILFNNFEYFASAYANTELVPKGILWLIGSSNNTVAWTNPAGKVQTLYVTSDLRFSDYNYPQLTDRDLGNDPVVRNIGVNFIANKIRVGQVAFETNNAGIGVKAYGSNNMPTFDGANIDQPVNWTLLGSLASTSAGWNTIVSNNNSAWQFIKIQTDGFIDINFRELEFYNSTIYSPTLNLT